ncbi:hypothetical protein BDA99DRAFT_519162 [Phascolomyces articulosus]|uniref:Protein SET n=1 Tax=Phascolomyces articulosus TaxID=60185 RepID=A0AAD5K4E5_9FUNG|nr:hypothetical protein BDA99DRAFT_519162 [Phascolomyces articulosus]
MSEEVINKELSALQEDTLKVGKEVEQYTRKLMIPIWNKRRDVIKKIPNFWTQAMGNSPLFAIDPSENDIEALENLTDFHVEFDEARPEYRKVIATFKKNDIFKNETLTKEFINNDEGDDEIISKATIEYHSGKGPSKKRKADDDDEEGELSFLEWFASDENGLGSILSDEIFPGALEYFQGDDDEDDDDAEEIELGSEDEDEEDDEPAKKKSKK